MTPHDFCSNYNFPQGLVYAYLNEHIGTSVPKDNTITTNYVTAKWLPAMQEYTITVTDPCGLYSEICRLYRFPQLTAQKLYDLVKAALISDPSLKSHLL